MNRPTCLLFAALALAFASSAAQAQRFVEPCARAETFPLPATNGPYDYRTEIATRRMVESNHFTPRIENLIRGRTGTLAQELSFLLHAFPNHHRGLAALVRYGEREKSVQPADLDYSVECYFLRAIRFRPDDLIVRMLFAEYLGRLQRVDDAATQLAYVKLEAADDPVTQYNLGLVYFEIGRYAEALAQAHTALALGMTRSGLMEQLKAKGQWVDPPAAAPDAPASAAGQSSQ